MSQLEDLLREHHVLVESDNAFQQRARLLQSMWRERRGYRPGSYVRRRGSQEEVIVSGSRLAMPEAQTELLNYLTGATRDRVRREVAEAPQTGKLLSRPRLYDNLLSSQPLCFNLFAMLDEDRELASQVLRDVWPEHVDRVQSIAFEWSPGRGDVRYLDNRSAFDIFVRHTTPQGDEAFTGIEMKYHENLRVKPATHKSRYDDVAASSGVFVDDLAPALRRPPVQQIWLDHLLALSILPADATKWAGGGRFVVMYPEGNSSCVSVLDRYRKHLSSSETFTTTTIEQVLAALRLHSDAPWIDEFHERYLDFALVDQLAIGQSLGAAGG